MKILKICMIVLSIGIITASCSDKCPPATTNASSTSAANAADGTNTTATTTADTIGIANENGSENTSQKTGAVGSQKGHYTKHDTVAKATGPDMKASKKREGNFTNGTGTDYPGK